LTSVTIPISVTSIGESAFAGCNGLKTVNWNAKNCGDFSHDYDYKPPFYQLKGITTFNFGNEVEKIPAYLCCELSGLTSVIIPNSVTSIGRNAFGGCSGLTSVTLGNSVTSIGNYAFYCTGLKDVKCFAKNPPSLINVSEPFYTYSIPLSVPAESVEKYKTAYGWSRFKTIIGI